MLSKGFALRIELRVSDSGTTLELQKYKGGKENLKIESKFNKDQLDELVQRTRSNLEDFKKASMDDWASTNVADISEAMDKLFDCGLSLLLYLCDKNVKSVKKIEKFCRQACPLWHKHLWDRENLEQSVVEFHTETDYGIPIEILPVFHTSYEYGKKGKKIHNKRDVGDIASCFLGFSTIVKWRIKDTFLDCRHNGKVPKLLGMQKLPVKFLQYKSLEGVREELDFFKDREKDIEIRGPWPDGTVSSNEDFEETFLTHLFNPRSMLKDEAGGCPDQVLHLTCHCDTTSKNSDDFKLILSYKKFLSIDVNKFSITLSRIILGFSKKNMQNSSSLDWKRPLVFVNACGSAFVGRKNLSSFPEFFLNKDYNYLGFIGIYTDVPDAFAAKFPVKFYDLLIKGDSLGVAFLKARWEILKLYNSPLGILYNLYADPEIKVRKADYKYLT